MFIFNTFENRSLISILPFERGTEDDDDDDGEDDGSAADVVVLGFTVDRMDVA